MAGPEGCEAEVNPDGWHPSRCSRKAKTTRAVGTLEHGLCGQHAAQFDRWEAEGRPMAEMTRFHWKWRG